jgi:hypothetical protein
MGPAGLSEDHVPKAAIVFKLFFSAVVPGYLLCELVSKAKISRGEMEVRRAEA